MSNSIMSRNLLTKFTLFQARLTSTVGRGQQCICTGHSQLLSTFIPIVVEQSGRGDRSYDIYSRLLRSRIVCLMGPIDDLVSSVIVAQLLFLQAESTSKPIHVYINSPGGVVSAGLAIYDTMQYVQPPIVTWCIGQACSMGSLLLAAGTPGLRHTLPNSRIMIHQPSGGAKGQATDILIHAEEIIKLKSQINDLYAKHTGLPLETIEKFIERDKYMSAKEAKDLGLVDIVLEAPQKKGGSLLKDKSKSSVQIPKDDLVHQVVEKVSVIPTADKQVGK